MYGDIMGRKSWSKTIGYSYLKRISRDNDGYFEEDEDEEKVLNKPVKIELTQTVNNKVFEWVGWARIFDYNEKFDHLSKPNISRWEGILNREWNSFQKRMEYEKSYGIQMQKNDWWSYIENGRGNKFSIWANCLKWCTEYG
jgi:hypothetical protein